MSVSKVDQHDNKLQNKLDTQQAYGLCEAAAVLRMALNTVYRMVRTGELPGVKVGRRVSLPIAAVDELLKEHNHMADHVILTPTASPNQYIARTELDSGSSQLTLVRLRVGELLPARVQCDGTHKNSGSSVDLLPEVIQAVKKLQRTLSPAQPYLRGVWIDNTQKTMSLYVSVHVKHTDPQQLDTGVLAGQMGHDSSVYCGHRTFVRVDLHKGDETRAGYTSMPETEYDRTRRDIHWI